LNSSTHVFSRYKVPRRFIFVDALACRARPYGKVLKEELRKQLALKASTQEERSEKVAPADPRKAR